MTKLILTSTDKNVILDLDEKGRVTMKKRTMTDEQLREVAYSDTIYDILELREIVGLSQRGFSEKYGIPRRTIENWEKLLNKGESGSDSWVMPLLNRVVKDDIKHDLRYGKKVKK